MRKKQFNAETQKMEEIIICDVCGHTIGLIENEKEYVFGNSVKTEITVDGEKTIYDFCCTEHNKYFSINHL